jgi:hypothetical protein
MDAVRAYERPLVGKLIKGLQAIPGVTLYGITDPFGFDRRAPTVAFTLEGYTPRQVAERLGQAGIFVWDGNYYALAVTERLGVEESGGMVRVGIAHYNTAAEVDRLLAVVNDLAVILDNERNHLIDPTASCEERTGPASDAGPVVFGYPASRANWLYASLRGEHQVLFTSPRLVLAHQVPMEHV